MTYTLIGILGGTFDPIHLGHLHLAQTILHQTEMRYIKFIPCYQSPHRVLPNAPVKDRIAMINLAINNKPYFKLDNFEAKKSKPSFTINTLEHLHKTLPQQSALCLIIGADAFAQFTLWHDWQKIPQLCHLIIATRPGIDANPIHTLPPNFPATVIKHPLKLNTAKAGYVWLTDIQPLDISATAIRHTIQQGKDAAAYLPSSVWEYIDMHNLYR